MQGFKLSSRKRIKHAPFRRNSLDSKTPKLPRIFQSKEQFSHTLEISSIVLQRSPRLCKENASLNSNQDNQSADPKHFNTQDARRDRLTQLREPRHQLLHTYHSFTVEGVRSSPQSRLRHTTVYRAPRPGPPQHAPKVLSEGSVRELLYVDWLEMIRAAHGVRPGSPVKTYKYYIGKGNNSSLISQILKTRWWWCSTENPAEANLVWTQLKHRPTLERLSTLSSETSPHLQPNICGSPRIVQGQLQAKYQEQGFNLIRRAECYKTTTETNHVLPNTVVLHNRLPKNWHICCKKRLLQTMRSYYAETGTDVFTKMPLTFHVSSAEDPQLSEFTSQFVPGSLWIVKPGEGTNRGYGIRVLNDLTEICEMVANAPKRRSYIIQKYIANPLLVNKRKFDIRCYGLISCIGSQIQGYFYKEGYIRTASRDFSLKKPDDKFIHLTNDAIQKRSEDYGRFESGNKLSYSEFQRYLTASLGVDFYTQVLPQIQQAVTDSMKAVYKALDKANNTFEVFGYDFMVDEDLNVWLIEVNSNPCLELSCSHLAKTIPAMLDNAFRIVLDPVFPAPTSHKKFKNWVQDTAIKNEFVLVLSG